MTDDTMGTATGERGPPHLPAGRGGVETELLTVALVDDCLAISIDLALVVVVDDRACRHAIIRGVVCVSELAVELKLRRSVLPFLAIVIEHTLVLIVGCTAERRLP